MNELNKLHQAVEREFDSRNLASRTRYSALNNVITFIKEYYQGNISCLEMDKKTFQVKFVEQTGYTGQASKSAINELYNQYNLMKNGNNNFGKTSVIEKKNKNKTFAVNIQNNTLRSFPPVIDSSSQILILGTMPGPESLQTGQYYTSSNNSFWKIIANKFNNGVSFTSYDEKIDCLKKNHIALWDVYQTCNRINAADNTITNEIPNDIDGLLKKYPSIKRIILNGNKAADSFHASVPYIKVCSSAAYIKLEEKIAEWSKWLTI